jgi:hypothetical protein
MIDWYPLERPGFEDASDASPHADSDCGISTLGPMLTADLPR